MSIKANISKKWLVSSHQIFYNFLEKESDLTNNSTELSIFRDHLFLSKYGCPCNSEENEQVSLEIYKQLDKLDGSIINKIKSTVGCTSIIFQLDGENLFEL